jgi:hypothetical protein
LITFVLFVLGIGLCAIAFGVGEGDETVGVDVADGRICAHVPFKICIENEHKTILDVLANDVVDMDSRNN